jgi:hypothetical protein
MAERRALGVVQKGERFMDPSVRRLALRAAAKLAFSSVVLGGCGGSATNVGTSERAPEDRNPLTNAGGEPTSVPSSAAPTPSSAPNADPIQTGPIAVAGGGAAGAGATGKDLVGESMIDMNRAPDPSDVEVSEGGASAGTEPLATAPTPGNGEVALDGGMAVEVEPADAQATGTLACLGAMAIASFQAPNAPGADEARCCRDYTTAKVAELGRDEAANVLLAADASFVNCCRALINDGDVNGVNVGASDSCCSTTVHGLAVEQEPDLWAHTYCSPWGPPVPPSMDYGAHGVA